MKRTILIFISIITAIVSLAGCGCGKKEEEIEREAGFLSTTVMELELGQTDEIKVLNYSGSVEWSSSNENFVTVSQSGVVTPVAIGSASITAKLDNGDEMTCLVDIVPGTSIVEVIKVAGSTGATDITLQYSSSPTYQLKASCDPYSPDEVLTWYSSDEKLATVDSKGLVTLRGNGTVTIYAKAYNGVEGSCIVRIKGVPENAQPPQSSESEREVVELSSEVPIIETEDVPQNRFTSPVPRTSPTAASTIIISDRRVYLNVAESFKLTYAVGNTENEEIAWMSSDKTVAVVSDGRIVAIGDGTATISAVTHDGAVASCKVAVGEKAIEELKSEVQGK